MAAFQPLVILGPTASGKSALAMAVARRAGAAILSADSMQVYRHMDVGTAKPTLEERREVPHYLLDIVEPDEPFTVARFVALADAVLADAGTSGQPVIVTGGTPLYFKSLFAGLFEGPGADAAVRERLSALAADELARRLGQVDPAAAARIHANDGRRMVRALEVYELTGKPISLFQTHWIDPEPRRPAVWVGLNWEKDALNRRINGRVRQMLAGGWVEETGALVERYGQLSQTAAGATGYAELIEHVRSRLPLDEAAERIKIATRQLARRQTKWFRRFPNVTWLPGDQPTDVLADRAMALWATHG